MLSTKRVRIPLKFRQVQVVDAHAITPGLRSITFGGPDLADFESLSFADHLKLFLPPAPGADIVLPIMTPNGPDLSASAAPPVMRDFTPRAIDRNRRRVTLEFALHADGFASTWGRHAKVGDRAVFGGPRGSTVIPTEYEWHLLAGDESALPAIARRLEELSDDVRVDVIVETSNPADQRALTSKADLRTIWLETGENSLADAIRTLDAPWGTGFVWAAGESASMRKVRAVLRDGHARTSTDSHVSAYWKRGASAHHEDIA